MKKGWTTTKLMAVGGLAVLEIVVELLGASLQTIVGIPLGGGPIYIFTSAIFVMICLLVIDELGAATLMRFVLGILSIPLPSTGMPGFVPKVAIFLGAGIIADLLYSVLKRHKTAASLTIGAQDSVYYGLAIIWLGRLFSLPGIEASAELFLSPLPIIGVSALGALGGYLGYLAYQKIKDTAVVKRIQS